MPKKFMPRPYLLTPRDAFEATYGKAVLLTDVMIAQILDALAHAKAQTKEGQEAIACLYGRLMDAWDEDCPYEKEAPPEA